MPQMKIKGNTKPELFVNGRKTAPVLYGLSDFPGAASNTAYAQKNIRRFAEAGIDLVEIDTDLRLGWHKVSLFNPEAMISEVENVLDANPNAKVHIRLHVNAPYWWMRDNPEELAVYRFPDGDRPGIDDGDHDRLIAGDYEYIRVSLASEKWLAEAGEKLALLCDAFAAHPVGDAIMSIQVACGLNGEWHKWGQGEDVSEPAKRAFHRFLYKKYGSNEAFAEAYEKQCLKRIEDAEYHPERFQAGDDGDFRDPARSRLMIDSAECAQDIVADDILYFCRIVKEHLPNVLAGAFYGYYLQTRGDHLKVEKLFAAKGTIDFLCGPCCYIENRKPWGVPMQRGLLESCRLNGVLWLTEMDQAPEGLASRALSNREYVATEMAQAPEGLDARDSSKQAADGGVLWKAAERTKDELSAFDEVAEKMHISIGILRRNVLMPLLAGQGLWFYDHRVIPPNLTLEQRKIPGATGSIYRKCGWWEEEALMEEIEGLKRIADRITGEEYEATADVLIVYDTESYYYRANCTDPEYKLHAAVHHSGVAVDTIYLSDIEKADLQRYKCVIIPNSYMLTAGKREKLRSLLAGRTKIWLGASGFSDGERLSEEFISKTVGMKISRLSFKAVAEKILTEAEEAEKLSVEPREAKKMSEKLRDTDDLQATGKASRRELLARGQGILEGCECIFEPLQPHLYVSDANCERLLSYGDGRCAAARCGEDIWLPAVPSEEIFARLIKLSGAHVYVDYGKDTVLAGAGIVAINAPSGGDRTINLPSGKKIRITLPEYTTVAFDIQTGERII